MRSANAECVRYAIAISRVCAIAVADMTLLYRSRSAADLPSRVGEQRVAFWIAHVTEQDTRLFPMIVVVTMVPMSGVTIDG